MSVSYPTSLDTLTNPTASDDTSTVDHASQHADANDAIEALEAKVGINSSAVTTSLDYKVTNASSVDPGHKHTPTTSLAITGTPDGTKFLRDDDTWATPPTTTSASVTVEGTVESATTAEIDADTATGGTGAELAVTPDKLAASKYGTQLPSADEKAALAGTGTPNGTTGLYVTNDDVSDAAASGKIVRATGTALPALSGANLTSLPVGKLISYDPAPTSISSSSTETTLWSVSLAGGELSTGNVVKGRIDITDIIASSGQTLTLKLKYGATTVATGTWTTAAISTGEFAGYIDFILAGAGTTSSQNGKLDLFLADHSGNISAVGNVSNIRRASGTATEDSTGALTLSVTAKFSVSDSLTVDDVIATIYKV